MHAARLASSCKLMHGADEPAAGVSPLLDPAHTRALLSSSIAAAIRCLEAVAPKAGCAVPTPASGVAATAAVDARGPPAPTSLADAAAHANDGEYKITCLLVWGADHVGPLVDFLASLLASPAPVALFRVGERAAAGAAADTSTASAPVPSGASGAALEPLGPAATAAAATDALRGDAYLLLTHVCALPPRRPPPIAIQVRGAPRSNALAKDSEWVKRRVLLEASKPSDVEEVVLCDDATGDLLEGTQTNFFAVYEGGVVRTAGAGVLEGTVRRLVMEVAPSVGATVELAAPRVADIGAWEAAFITSTSRLLLPVDAVEWGDDAHVAGSSAAPAAASAAHHLARQRVLNSSGHPMVAALQKAVLEAVRTHSTRVITE